MEIIIFIFFIVIFIFSAVIHEVAHGAAALALGDPTAKTAGRLTLNPLKHLDPIGSVLLPLTLLILTFFSKMGFIFGWAKPVPINPNNFSDQKYGPAKSAAAGPLANLAIALVFGLLLRFLPLSFSLYLENFYYILAIIVYINILLAIFNLLPIPPLDGSYILFAFLPDSAQQVKLFLYQYGIILLLFIIFFGLDYILSIIRLIFYLITGQPLSF